MRMTRRELLRSGLAAGLSYALIGCGGTSGTTTTHSPSGDLPGVPWPQAGARSGVTPPSSSTSGVLGRVIPRRSWTRYGTINGRANPMRGVSRITIHHEGSANNPVYFTDAPSTRRRLEQVRQQHVQRGWADIGYHYVIDRGGNVYQGRPVSYQGAHVRDNNEHNIGVMVLGNFDIQTPSKQQLAVLPKLISELRRKYKVRDRSILTHREINPTQCPGRHLQSQVAVMRTRRAFA